LFLQLLLLSLLLSFEQSDVEIRQHALEAGWSLKAQASNAFKL